MERYKSEQQEKIIGDELDNLVDALSEITNEHPSVKNIDGTYEIEADSFSLTFAVNEKVFEIRSIDVRGNNGLGHQIIEAVHEYSDEIGLEVIASNVLDTAQGFWERMGYQEGDNGNEYFRAE